MDICLPEIISRRLQQCKSEALQNCKEFGVLFVA